MISTGTPTISRKDIISQVCEADIIGYYLGINSIPKLINSPFREDKNPSFYIYSPNGKDVNFVDFGNGDKGGCMTLLMRYFKLSRSGLYKKIQTDLLKFKSIKCEESSKQFITHVSTRKEGIELQCKIRRWRQYDLDYWNSYGISLEWLTYCEVYPISHKIIIKNGKRMVFGANKYAYAFVERKEDRITYKFYQPFNKEGFKWQNNNAKSVLGLWTKMPSTGKDICICSSVKDALCLMANLGIPCICLQGEGYPISDTAIKVLKKRFKNLFICLDNDEAGLKDAQKLADKHSLINVVIPADAGGKDISDVYKYMNNKQAFCSLFKKLFREAFYDFHEELPF